MAQLIRPDGPQQYVTVTEFNARHLKDTSATPLELVNGYTGDSWLVRRGNTVDIVLNATAPAGGMPGGAQIAFVPAIHRPHIARDRYVQGTDNGTGGLALTYYNASTGYICHVFARVAGSGTKATFTWLAPD